MNFKKIITANIINFILLGLVIAIAFFFPIWVPVILGIGWLIYAIYTNYQVIMVENDIIEELKSANKKNIFNAQIKSLETSYKSIISRSEIFTDPDSKNNEVYELIVKQAENNIRQAIAFINSYDYYSRPPVNFLNEQVRENNELMGKLNQMIELMVNIDTSVHDVDTSYVDDLLNALKAVQKGNF